MEKNKVSFAIVLRVIKGILNIVIVQDDPIQSSKPWGEDDSKYKLPGGGDAEGIVSSVKKETNLDVNFFEWSSLFYSKNLTTHLKNFYLLLYNGGEIKFGGGVRKAIYVSVNELEKMLEMDKFLPDHREALNIFVFEWKMFQQEKVGILNKYFEALK